MLKIYTGYAWREMNPEEIEIINWQAVHTDEPDNPQAGDIYDQAPYSREDCADAKAQGLDLDDWNDYQRYCRMGARVVDADSGGVEKW